MTTFDKLKGAAATLADAAVKTTGDLAQKGKKQMDLLALENKLSRAQRQLGDRPRRLLRVDGHLVYQRPADLLRRAGQLHPLGDHAALQKALQKPAAYRQLLLRFALLVGKPLTSTASFRYT